MQGYNNDITFEDEIQCYDLYFPAFGHSNHPFLPLLVFVCNRIFTLIKLDIFRNEIQKSGKMRLMICLITPRHAYLQQKVCSIYYG